MNDFLDSYKQLEKLCNEIYNQNNGVTQYISDMESKSGFNTMYIPGWDRDFRRLKEVRHIRNAMVHDATDDGKNYSEDDVAFLQDFYQRIMDGSDPLAMSGMYDQSIEMYSKPQSKGVRHGSVDIGRVHKPDPQYYDAPKKKKRKIAGLAGGIFGVIFFLCLLIFLLTLVLKKSGILF